MKKSYGIDYVLDLMATKRKSFYGKAKVMIVKGGDPTRFLVSYNTIHCAVDECGRVHRFSDYKSNTTCSHLSEFLRDDYKGYWELPLEKKPKIIL